MSVFAPGSTVPTATLTGLYKPDVLAFDGSGNLYILGGYYDTVSKFAPGSTTPTATLAGLDGPIDLAADSSGNVYVLNYSPRDKSRSVSKFTPGSTTPSDTLAGLNSPTALACDPSGNLFVANGNASGTACSKFAPGSTTPTATLTGLASPGPGLRRQRQPLRGQLRQQHGEQVRSGEHHAHRHPHRAE